MNGDIPDDVIRRECFVRFEHVYLFQNAMKGLPDEALRVLLLLELRYRERAR